MFLQTVFGAKGDLTCVYKSDPIFCRKATSPNDHVADEIHCGQSRRRLVDIINSLNSADSASEDSK